MKITLPASIDLDEWCCHDEDGDKVIMNPAALLAELRARDLEVARVVLEAAAKVCENPGPYWDWDDFTNAVLALEISHE